MAAFLSALRSRGPRTVSSALLQRSGTTGASCFSHSTLYGMLHGDQSERDRVVKSLSQRQTAQDKPPIQALFIELPAALRKDFERFNTDTNDANRTTKLATLMHSVVQWRSLPHRADIEAIVTTASKMGVPVYPVDTHVLPEEEDKIRRAKPSTGSITIDQHKRLVNGNIAMIGNIQTLTRELGIDTFAVVCGAAHHHMAEYLAITPDISDIANTVLRKYGIRVDKGNKIQQITL